MKTKKISLLSGASAALMHFPALAHACAVCLSGPGDPTADAFNASVLFLMATPYAVMGSVAGWLIYSYRRAAAKRQRQEAAEPSLPLAWNPKESEK